MGPVNVILSLVSSGCRIIPCVILLWGGGGGGSLWSHFNTITCSRGGSLIYDVYMFRPV